MSAPPDPPRDVEAKPHATAPRVRARRPPDDDGPALLLVPAEAMHARLRAKAIMWVWAFEFVVALVMSWPWTLIVRRFYGGHPDGDAPLWEPGALSLVDLVVHAEPMLTMVLLVSGGALVFGVFAGIVPQALLLVSIAHVERDLTAPTLRNALPRAFSAFGPMFALLLVAGALEGLVVVLFALLGDWVGDGYAPSLGTVRANLILVAFVVLGVVFAAIIGVAHDLARAAVVRFQASARRSMALALRTFASSKLRTLWAWGWRAAAGVVPVALGAFASERLGGLGGRSLFALLCVHQLVVLTRVSLRASWLSRALRAVDAEEQKDGTT